mgnify:CR=1 FL=1
MTIYMGLTSGTSKDEKPEHPEGWTFYETDTGIAYLKTDGEWVADKENPYLALFKKPK